MSEYIFEGNYAESANYLNSLIPTNPLVLDQNYMEQVKAVLEYGKVGDLQKVLLMHAEISNALNKLNSEFTGNISNYRDTYSNANVTAESNKYLENYKQSLNG